MIRIPASQRLCKGSGKSNFECELNTIFEFDGAKGQNSGRDMTRRAYLAVEERDARVPVEAGMLCTIFTYSMIPNLAKCGLSPLITIVIVTHTQPHKQGAWSLFKIQHNTHTLPLLTSFIALPSSSSSSSSTLPKGNVPAVGSVLGHPGRPDVLKHYE
jgi:hypothetical protein